MPETEMTGIASFTGIPVGHKISESIYCRWEIRSFVLVASHLVLLPVTEKRFYGILLFLL